MLHIWVGGWFTNMELGYSGWGTAWRRRKRRANKFECGRMRCAGKVIWRQMGLRGSEGEKRLE
jgi:hypothetical protein